ncbi:uncharacterized protein LOC117102173 isoform X3 [Anneissia japonica]|uniref:uncharacterized protein LOC117102173 isoform X3 n=1 Tax=Anneissia japonica TaxID=1529436 RepID=UPI0014254DB2|nr:uncharacterized protein LOC117102173 isoform X3 [Anneissia japonica]
MERSVAAPTYSNLIPENCPQTVTQVEVESKRNAQWLEQSPGKLHNKHDGQLKPLAIKDQIIMKYARIYHAEQNINELLEKRRGHTTVNHHLFNPSQYKPTKFYSSMNYDMSVPCKYLGGKPVPSKGEINIEVCVKPTCTSIDHTIHKQCRTVTRAYRSELVVQLGTTKGKLYQSNTHRPNRDVIKLQKNDVAEQKTLGITSLRVEHDTHIPIDIVIANDSDKSIAPNMEMGRDSNDCPSRVNEYQSEDNSVLWGANHLLTTAQPQELENITKVMSKSLTDGSKIGLRSDIMVINHDQAIHLLKNEKSSHLCLNMNSQTLKHTKDTFKPNECVNTLTKLDEYTTSRSNGVIGLNSETTNDSNDNYDLRKVKSNDGLAMGFLSESVLYKCTNDSKPKIARNVLYDTDVKRDRPNKACDTPTTFDNKYRNNEPDLTDYVRVTTKDYNSRTDDEPGARVPADDKRVVSYDFLGKIDNDPGRCHGDCSDTDDERSSIDNVRVATDYEQIAAEDEKETPNFKGEMASKGLNCLNCMPSLGYNENLSSSKIGINLHGDQRRVWNAVHSKMVFNTDKDECSNECQQIHDSGLLEHTSAVVCAQGLRNFLEDANLSETIVYIENENDVMESISEMSNSYLPAIGHSELQIKTNLLTSYEVLKSDNDVTYEHGEEIIIEKSNMAIQQPGSQIPIMSSPLFTDMLNSNQLTQSIADAQNMDHIVEEKQIDEEKVSPVDGARDGSLSRTTTKLECEETLCKQKGFTHNDPLAEEGSSIDSDMHGSVCSKKCTSDSGYSITVHSHESRRNYSTDTEFESIREDANTDNTEDSNGSSESEYETASSNFKYSDVSDFENDVDEDPKMPLPVVTINVEMATPPEFAFRPQSRVVERGSTAKFICVLKGCPKPEVTWFNHGIILRDSKKHRSYEGIENMFVLEVTDVDPSDAGEYVCTASNSEGRIYASAELSIEELTLPIEQQQEPYFMNRLEDLTAFPGTDIQFCCQVGGNSAPQILWFHNGIGLKRCERFSFSRSDDGRCTLRITSIKADDEGEVACVASNVLGRATCCAYLNVKEYSKFTHEEHTDGNSNSVEQNVESLHHTTPYVPNIVAIEGTSTKFKCSVIGNPKPSVTWHKDGHAIDQTMHAASHYHILEEGYTHTLEIPKTQDSDAGHYYCTVSNKTGAVVCSCFLLVNDRKDNNCVVSSVISPMTISSKVTTVTRPIDEAGKKMVEPRVTINNAYQNIKGSDQDLVSSEKQQKSILTLELERNTKIDDCCTANEVEMISNNGAILKDQSQNEDVCHVKLSDSVTLQCITPGMNINIGRNINPDKTSNDNCTQYRVDDSFIQPFMGEVNFTPINLATHLQSDYVYQRSYDGDNSCATDDSTDSTDQLLYSLQMAQNSVEVDSDDDLLHVVGYQNSTRNRLFNNTSDPDLDMERAIRLSEKVDTCMDIVNTVLNLASLDNEGEKELRMRLEELRSGLSSSGSSTTDDQESSVNSLTSRSNCNTSLSIDEHLLSVDSKDIEPINPQDVSLESEISDIESLNRSSSCLNMEYVSSPLKNQRMQGYKQDPSFPEMAAHLLNIHNPYEMIRKVEAENKDTSIEMMADVLSSQIVIEGLSNYSKCKKNISNIPTKKAIGCKAGTTNIKTASNTNYLKAIGSFADKVVAEILIDAALRIKDITQSRHSYHTKEKMKGLNLPYDHANNLPQQLLNELIKEASEKTSQKNKLDQEIFNDLLHEIMLQAVVSEILKTRTPTLIHWNQQICKENTLQNNEHEETGKNNDAILKKLNSDFQMPLHLVDVSAPIPTSRQCDRYSISIEKGSVSDLRKNEKEKEILSINIESLDNPEKMSTCITAPEPKLMVPNFTQGLEMEEPISANLRKVKARNILSGFLGNAMLLEQQKLKPTVKLSRSQSDRTQRPILQLHGNLKTELKEPKGLLKRSFSERRGQGIKFQQENEKEVKASESKTTSPVKSEQVILPQENNVGNSETLKRSSAAQELPLAVTIQEPNTMKTEDQQLNLVSTEEPKHNNLERKKSEESDDQKVPQKSSISRSMSARIPVRRKSHSFIRKDPRYLSWQANNLPFQKEDTSSNRCRSVPNRTQSLFLPRSQFQQDQIVKEKNNKQNVIHEIATEQTKDKYIEEFCITNDVSVLFMEENKDRDNKNMKELTIHNKDIINEHVTIQNGQKHNDYVKDDKREKPEVLKDEFSVTKRPIRANRSDRPISSLINMFETTIKSSPRSSKVQEFGLTFKLDEKAKKARSVNRSQSMLCRKKENIVNVKMDNRLSMDGSVHLSQLDTLNICKDIIYQESVEKPDKKLVVYNELEHSSSGLTVPPTKSVSNNNELNVDNDVILATPVQQDDDDVFSLPVTNNSSCEEEPLYTKSRSLSSIELQQPEYNSESSDFEGAPTFRQTISPVTVKDGDPARLDVGVIGNPDPDIKWFKDGKELTEDQHYQYVLDENDVWSLILAEATPSDSGEYTCQAQNCHGSVSCTGYLKVEDDVANITEAELLLELRESSISNNQDNETVARLLKEHQENKTRNGSVSTSGAEDEMFCQYTVLDNYHNDRLSVQQGDKVEILETQSNEIWLIKHVDSSMIGYIPVSLLEKLDEEDSVKAKRNSVKLAIKELFPDIATPTENMYEKKLKRKMSAKERLLAMRQISDQDDSRDTFDMCVAIASYTPDEDDSDHIPLVEGQYVEILDSDSAIEWLVQTKPTKFNHPKRGWVPASHLMKDGSNMVPGQTESLNRMISRVILDEGDADLVGSKKQEALIKRRYVLEELLQTERTFVKNMLFCIESYLPLMDEQNAPPAVKGKKDVLFLNFEKICEFHKNIFVKELEECGNDAYSVGRAFIKWQCNFEYHVQYCKNKPKSESCLTPVVKACFDDYLRSKGIIDKFSLSDYLIKPIQRITKYQLLLKEVVKYTSRAKEDCIELEMALNVMMQVPKRANDLMHISLIEGFQGNINDLGKLYRQEDFTVWTGKQKGRGKERHVFLFKDQIMLTKIKKDPRSEGFTYAYKNHMTIPGIGMTEESRDERCFELWYGKASSSLSMTLQAKTKYVKEAWVKEIRSLLEQKQMEMLEAKASVERIYGTLSNSSLLSKSSESLTFNETPSQQLTSDLGATFSLSVPDRLHGDSFTSIDSDTPPQNDCKELEVGALYEMSDDFIAGGLCGLELSKGEIVKLVETENNNVCIVQSMPSPGCCNGEEGSVPPYLLRRRKSVEEPVSIVEKPENLSVNVGDYAKFICTFSGMPTPTADWYFKGHVLENTKRIHADNGLWVSSVTITNVKGEDSGKYRCVISNAISTKSCTANLHVAYVWESQCTDAIECPDDVLQEFDDDTVTWLPDNSPSIATDQLLTGPFEMG